MRRNGLGVVGGVSLWGIVALFGCAPPPSPLDEGIAEKEPARTEVTSAPSAAAANAALAGSLESDSTLEIRELKVVEDNGQQGVFAKLSRAPHEVSYYTLANPNRLVVEILGKTSGVFAEQYPVENPVIEQVRVGADEGKIRLTIALNGADFPTYTVNDLNDTLVAFIGEPAGTNQAVKEQIVFTQRAVPASSVAADPPVAARVPAAPQRPAPAASTLLAGSGADVHSQPPRPAEMEVAAAETGPALSHRLYYGQPISLDLKDADIHNVLRLVAEVSNLNIVATDDVKGQITLRLFDVPWDQALDIILQVMNLESVQEGNVLRISTVKRLREEREELAKAQIAQQVVEPLEVAYLQVNYAKAKKLADLVSGQSRRGGGQGSSSGRGRDREGVLTPRGSVLVDEFTNTLIVRDIARGIRNARELVNRLDVQIPQVLIESNIVEATTDFARELGIQWGYRRSVGPQTGTSTGVNFPGTIGFGGSGLNTGAGGTPFMVDFPAAGNFAPGSGTALDLALGSLDGSRSLDLRLTALESKGKGRIVSRPRVVTLNNVAATIKSLTILRVRLPSTGTVINTGAGGAAGAQESATEKIETGIILTVTPQVSADGFVLLDLFAKSSQADFTRTVDNIPTEITREATSHVLVRDGQTVVLGGIYRDTSTENTSGVPFFDSIPGLKWLFRNESRLKRREDLLVFLTPRVLTAVAKTAPLPSAAELWQNRDGENQG